MDNLFIAAVLLIAMGFPWGFLSGFFFYKELQRRIEKRNKKTGREAGGK